MRIDAVSLCYTDVKEIDAGDAHPRLTERNLKVNPIVPGHEISFTVIGVGKNLSMSTASGNDSRCSRMSGWDGKSVPSVLAWMAVTASMLPFGREILHGDAGNYLIPVPDGMPYASSAITEPWACVEAAIECLTATPLKRMVWFFSGAGSTHASGIRSIKNGFLPTRRNRL
jgi:threonine dehydrogenase-like Zn-dependent dehydrogenase